MGLADRSLNRWLEGEPWARERLDAHAGRRFAIETGPVTRVFTILAGGTIRGEHSAAEACDLRLALAPLSIPSFLAEPGRWGEFVTASGDEALASTLKELASTLPWFVERSFAKALGPIAGRRLAEAGRSALSAPGYAASRLVANFATYARDESHVLADPSGFAAFTRDVEAASARTEALGERIGRLEARQHGG